MRRVGAAMRRPDTDDASAGDQDDRAWLASQRQRMEDRKRYDVYRRRWPTAMGKQGRAAGDDFDDGSDSDGGDGLGELGSETPGRKAYAHAESCFYSQSHLDFLFNKSQSGAGDAGAGSDTPWWISIADKWPYIEEARQEGSRLLRQAPAHDSFCLFDALGRRLLQHTIPPWVPPRLIEPDWFVEDYLGSALGGYTDRIRLLLARAPIHVDVRRGPANFTALILTAVDGRYQTARALLAAGVSSLV